MKLVVTEFLTLDGVTQGPGSPDEDTSEGFVQGGWFVPYVDATFVRRAASWLSHADALLLGRRTYDAFARDWPLITDPSDPFTALMNGLPKFVASQTLTSATWEPTTILTGDVEAQIAALKARPGRELQIHGSATLAQSLLAAGLVDVVRLVLAPVVVGHGRMLFPNGGAPAAFRLHEHDVTPGGLMLMTYEYVGTPEYEVYSGVANLV